MLGHGTYSAVQILRTISILFPRLYLVRVHLEAFGEFGQRALTTYGGEGYLDLERRTMSSMCSFERGFSWSLFSQNKAAIFRFRSTKICLIKPKLSYGPVAYTS